MGKPPEDLNRLDPLGVFGPSGGVAPDLWSKAMTDLANSEPAFEASARAFDSYLTMTASAHKLFAQFMGQILGQLNMPTQNEIISVAERLTNIEMRLDDLDAQLDAMAHNLAAIAMALPVLTQADEKDRPAPVTTKSPHKDGNHRNQPGGSSSKGTARRATRSARE